MVTGWKLNPDLAVQISDARQVAAACTVSGRSHAVLASLLNRTGLTVEARNVLRRSAQLPLGTAEDSEALGFVAFALGEHRLAVSFYQHVTRAAPADAQGWYNLATALRNVGALDEADTACRRCIAADPAMAQARLLQSHLRRQTSSSNHVDQLRTALASSQGNLAAEISLHYALGKELDDLCDHDEAFAHFSQGARMRRSALQYDVNADLAKLERIGGAFSLSRLASAPPIEAAGDEIFVIGLPRSGTTMIERVLTGSPEVSSNGETDNLMLSLLDAMAGEGGDVFDRVSRADPAIAQASYTRRAGIVPGAPVIEKLPMNYLYAGAIRTTLPSARIVRLRRNAMDNLFAMYSTLFGTAYPFSYDLHELADYMIALERLMAQWADGLGGQWLEVDYEEFVAQPSRYGEQLSRHCGIAWNENMLRIEHNHTPTATASAAQVRRPIHSEAVGRSLAYEKNFETIADKLAKLDL